MVTEDFAVDVVRPRYVGQERGQIVVRLRRRRFTEDVPSSDLRFQNPFRAYPVVDSRFKVYLPKRLLTDKFSG